MRNSRFNDHFYYFTSICVLGPHFLTPPVPSVSSVIKLAQTPTPNMMMLNLNAPLQLRSKFFTDQMYFWYIIKGVSNFRYKLGFKQQQVGYIVPGLTPTHLPEGHAWAEHLVAQLGWDIKQTCWTWRFRFTIYVSKISYLAWSAQIIILQHKVFKVVILVR